MRSKLTRRNCLCAISSARKTLARGMRAPEEAKRLVVEALQAERQAVDAGRRQIGEARGLDRIGIGLERDLDVVGGRPVRGSGSRSPLRRSRDPSTRAYRRRRRSRSAVGRAASAPRARGRRASASRHASWSMLRADMAVEVAIGAFADAERPVDVERQRLAAHSFSGRHELAEGVGAVAHLVLHRGVELAERLLVADRHEHRVVAEAAVAARRPHERSVDPAVERLGLAVVGPGDRQRAGEVGGAAPRRARSLRLRARPFPSRASSRDCRPRLPPSARRKCPAGREAHRRTGRCRRRARASPERSAASRAFKSALSAKVLPISSGSGRPSSSAPTQAIPSGSIRAAISRNLPGLCVAMTSLSPIGLTVRSP